MRISEYTNSSQAASEQPAFGIRKSIVYTREY
jgi:hypothetical protein